MTGYEEFLRRVPKVELHCHFEGTVRPGTFADLASKHGVALPTDDVDRLYDYDSIYEFLKIFAMVSSTLIDQEDFARAAYESIEDGVTLGNLRYREMFFNPTLHTKRGVPYKTVVDGLVDGIQAAEKDFGVPCRLIADVYRQDSPAEAREMVEQVLEHRRDELIGLGMDGAEAPDPPEQFVDAYRLAGSGGLRLTAHACEDAPAQNIATCLDVLGCERIDHGYHILGDDGARRSAAATRASRSPSARPRPRSATSTRRTTRRIRSARWRLAGSRSWSTRTTRRCSTRTSGPST